MIKKQQQQQMLLEWGGAERSPAMEAGTQFKVRQRHFVSQSFTVCSRQKLSTARSANFIITWVRQKSFPGTYPHVFQVEQRLKILKPRWTYMTNSRGHYSVRGLQEVEKNFWDWSTKSRFWHHVLFLILCAQNNEQM